MKGKWKAYSQKYDGIKEYIVGRQLDMSRPLHGGNIEYNGAITRGREAAQKLADELNREEEK